MLYEIYKIKDRGNYILQGILELPLLLHFDNLRGNLKKLDIQLPYSFSYVDSGDEINIEDDETEKPIYKLIKFIKDNPFQFQKVRL